MGEFVGRAHRLSLQQCTLNVGDAKTATNNNQKGSSSIESYYGRLNYAFDERYLLTATLRADGSSTFGSDNRWGWFPSLALAWRFKQEAFLKDVGWLSNGKLRFGWGLVGNQNAGAYAYGATMANVPTAYGTGFYPNNFANSKLKWEQTKAWNIGLDLNFLNNRIEFIFDAYLKNTDNLLMQAALPTYVSGVISSPWVNSGAMRNKEQGDTPVHRERRHARQHRRTDIHLHHRWRACGSVLRLSGYRNV